MYPKLIISDKAFELIQECAKSGHVLITGSLDEIVDTLTSLKRATLDKIVVVGDINPRIHGEEVENRLMKLLESLFVQAVFISSGDGFSDIFLSRFVEVKKEVSLVPVRVSSETGFRLMLRENLREEVKLGGTGDILYEVIKDASEFFPFYNFYLQSAIPKKNKLMEIWLRGSAKR